MESVDPVSKDGLDTTICTIRVLQNCDNLFQLYLEHSNFHIYDLEQISYPTNPRSSIKMITNV